jgi:3,4-dihydroxy 2-butanone 4-phosphate synthase/GTP cyclohydrolase II
MQPHNATEALIGSLKAAAGEAPAGMDFRDYGIGAQILHQLGARKMRLLSSNTRKIVGLEGFGLEVVEQIVPGSGP